MTRLPLFYLFFENRHLTMHASSLETIVAMILHNEDNEYGGIKSVAINEQGYLKELWRR